MNADKPVKDPPLVSIIVPLYNRVALVGETIASVMDQTYPHWELLVVDDGSTDGSYEYVASVAQQDSRVKLSRRPRAPKGAPTCRNVALEQAQGTYVIYLDSDDLLAPHCLAQRVEYFQRNAANDFLVFPIQYFTKEVGDSDKLFFRFYHEDYLTSFLLQSHWITMSPIWQREALLKLRGFDESLSCMQDGDLHVRALVEGMRFRVLRDAPVDGYLRSSDAYERISNRNDTNKLASKVYAHEKYYKLLVNKGELTPVRRTILAAQFLNIGWNYRLVGDKRQAKTLWDSVYDRRMITRTTYRIGKSFIEVRNWPFVRDSRIVAGVIKRAYQLILPKFLLFP